MTKGVDRLLTLFVAGGALLYISYHQKRCRRFATEGHRLEGMTDEEAARAARQDCKLFGVL